MVAAVLATEGDLPPAPAPVTVPEPEPSIHAAPALLGVVDHDDIRPEHRQLADTVLRILPALCRDNLRMFDIQYVDFGRRGLGGAHSIVVDGREGALVELIGHECGHVILGNLIGSAQSGESGFHDGRQPIYNNAPVLSFITLSWESDNKRKAGMDKTAFASGYGHDSDLHEDFAETFTRYVFGRGALRRDAEKNPVLAAKVRWMDEHLPMPNIPEDIGGSPPGGAVPWDATLLPVDLGRFLASAHD